MERLQALGIEAALVQGAREVHRSIPSARARVFQPFTHWPSGREMLIEGTAVSLRGATNDRGRAAGAQRNQRLRRQLLGLDDTGVGLNKAGVIARPYAQTRQKDRS